jgi:hypothetical protein
LRSDDSPQSSAIRSKSFVFRLLTGGLLVRIQPEEPISQLLTAIAQVNNFAIEHPAATGWSISRKLLELIEIHW